MVISLRDAVRNAQTMKTHIGQGTVLLFKGKPEKCVVFDRYGCSPGQEGLKKDAIELHGGNLRILFTYVFWSYAAEFQITSVVRTSSFGPS